MRAPAFWWRSPAQAGPVASLLMPFSHLYAFVTSRRMRRTGWHAPVPVLCCGNIGVGGAGKTPLVLDLAQRAIVRGHRPAFLSRGYGGRVGGGTRVNAQIHTARDVGDEPLLLSRIAPCYVGADRAVSARRAVADGADCLLMDDGFQNPTLHQDAALIVVDGQVGFGNGHVLPAGPLREPVRTGLARAAGVVVIGPDRMEVTSGVRDRLPCFHASLRQDTGSIPIDRPVVAFAGIGRPAKFFDGLAKNGIHPRACLGFADHHAYTVRDCHRLQALAEKWNACLVTTEKDAVRLPAPFRQRVVTVGLHVTWATTGMPEQILDLWLDKTER
ncbi:tetraacyldisaccharide 4'-kinase [Komagataeibacter saccharivorans]|uniref:tetraacyldisaccharide 4'-kinase n=1 Tax=Komagataeibacter saccharivorans TaxID=265959 RepID=UPI000C84D887|nr:tetraacyldisaccharide 4'-kinase [Komagataeibacter saccharivorans]PMP98816.1 Tetraacyldisaccharide 4'-kinase [Komagataeibacter saccharivorans]